MPRFLVTILQSVWGLVSTTFYIGGWVLVVGSIAGVIAFLGVTEMPGSSKPMSSPATSEELVRAGRLQQDVVALSKLTRDAAHPRHQEAAAQYIEAQLQQAGYSVTRQSYAVGAGVARNISVTIPAVDNVHRRLVVVGAHYDSAVGAQGANDNATGVAALLELARSFKHREAINADIQFIFYANGAAPHFGTPAMGSSVHARDLKDRGANVAAVLSLDSLGNYQEASKTQQYPSLTSKLDLLPYRYPDTGNFVAFIGDVHSYGLVRKSTGAFRRNTEFPSEGIPVLPATAGVLFSDHMPYVGMGYPALVVTDTANFRTKPSVDTADKVDYTKLSRVTGGLLHVVSDLMR